MKKFKLMVEPDKKEFHFENLTIDKYAMFEKGIDIKTSSLEDLASGGYITMMTSNMPKQLKEEIDVLIKKYCNH